MMQLWPNLPFLGLIRVIIIFVHSSLIFPDQKTGHSLWMLVQLPLMAISTRCTMTPQYSHGFFYLYFVRFDRTYFFITHIQYSTSAQKSSFEKIRSFVSHRNSFKILIIFIAKMTDLLKNVRANICCLFYEHTNYKQSAIHFPAFEYEVFYYKGTFYPNKEYVQGLLCVMMFSVLIKNVFYFRFHKIMQLR